MAYVVTAKWIAKEGEEERVLAAVEKMIAPSRDEAGCLFYQPHRDPEDARVFFFYEHYIDESAYAVHAESMHFKEYALEEAIPRLSSRERSFYQTLDV
jgi:quinol monooxygenase YgiN